jgi:4-hydroxy-2-oxoheptanedioate aldolase
LAAEARDLSLIVRIPEKQESYYKWCRDLNINRIQVPFVETAADAKQAIKHTMFSPKGTRGLCRFTRAADFSGKPKDQYLKDANESNQLILQIEGKRGIANIEEILNALTPNTSLFIGPYDLSQSLGIPGQIWDKKVTTEMEKIIKKCKKKNVKIGTFTDTLEGIKIWQDLGIDFIQYASDLNLFISAAKLIK